MKPLNTERAGREMLKWMDHIYADETLENADQIRDRLNQNKLTPGIYLLTLSHNPGHLMEILPAVSLKQSCVRELCPEIFGVAASKDSAMELSCRILKEVYDATGTFDVKNYLKNR